jgi:hypothetical protein
MTDFLRIYKEKYGDKTQTKIGRILTEFQNQFNEKFRKRHSGVGAYFILTSSGNICKYVFFLEVGRTKYKFLEIFNDIDKDTDVKCINVYQDNVITLTFENGCDSDKLESTLVDIMGYDRTIILVNNMRNLSNGS